MNSFDLWFDCARVVIFGMLALGYLLKMGRFTSETTMDEKLWKLALWLTCCIQATSGLYGLLMR